MNEKILIVDDEKNILDILTYALNKEGYSVERAYNGQEALGKLKSFNPNIIILDLMLPIINGYDVCKKIENENIGILMLTAKNDIVDKILGLELGADDYLTKPFDIREVIARVKSLCRRFKKNLNESNSNKVLTIKDLTIYENQRCVNIHNSSIDFTSTEFDLLFLLLSGFKTDGKLNENKEKNTMLQHAIKGDVSYTNVNDVIYFYSPIKYKNSIVAILELEYSVKENIKFYNNIKKMFYITGFSALVLGIALGILYFLSLTRDIYKMKNSVESIQKGDFHKIQKVNRTDELGELSKGLTFMSDTIEKNIKDLKTERDTLSLAVEKLKKWIYNKKNS